MNKANLIELMEFARKKTNELVDAIAATPDPAAVLAMRPRRAGAHRLATDARGGDMTGTCACG